MFMQNLPPIRIGGRLTKSEYQFTLQSPDTDELYKYSEIFLSKLKELPLLQDVTTDLQIKNPQVNVEIDRDKASSLDVTAEQIESGLGAAYGSLQISTIYSPTNQYQVITEVAPKYQRDPSALPLLYIRSSPGTLVPLKCRYQSEPGCGTPFSKPSGTASFSHYFIQSQARNIPRRCLGGCYQTCPDNASGETFQEKVSNWLAQRKTSAA